MEVIEILDEEIYDVNKDAQNIQMLPTNIDSSSDNESIKEAEMAYFTKNLGVSTIIYSTVPIEYPATSPDGVATVFSIQGWKNHMDAFNDIQYFIGSGGGSPIQKCPFFGNISVTKYVRECQGIKHCSFTDSDLINAEHCKVDFESDIFKQINKNNKENNKENYTYITFLAAQDSQCKFKQNGITCSGQPKLIRLLEKESYKYRWIIGCTNYKPQEKWHRYIEIDTQKIDIDLLRKLFNGEAITERNANQCSTIISKSSRTKKCAYIHHCDGSVMQGKIVNKPCNVKMYKFILNDLQECPFVALICVGVHNHPPPPPERILDNIKDNLQMMIKEAIEKDDVVTSGSIIQGNMLKAYFNKETLQEIHMSLNNIDKLRYLVAKTYKNLYPFGQHILGVFQSVYSKQFDLHNYVHKIGKLLIYLI
ncbi:unnamed protein product [Rhizophagus irregularis]|nr:unnamed protein product [Rhizophagus irregularis]